MATHASSIGVKRQHSGERMTYCAPHMVSTYEDESRHFRKVGDEGERTTKKPHFTDATEKKREQNRVSAKRSRAKKAILIDQLKLRVETLKGENSMLQGEVEKYFGERVAMREIMKARSTPLWMRELSQTSHHVPELPHPSPYHHRARLAAKHAPIASRSDILRLNNVENNGIGGLHRQAPGTFASNSAHHLGHLPNHKFEKERLLENATSQSIDDCLFGYGKPPTLWEGDDADGLGDVLSFFT